MNPTVDATHAPELTSWVESANDPGTAFPGWLAGLKAMLRLERSIGPGSCPPVTT